MKKRFSCLALLLICLAPLCCSAATPSESIKINVDNVISILKDPGLRGEARAQAKKARLRAASENMFDFNELSRRTLARNWNSLTDNQRREFTELYRSILENAYIEKITSYTDEKIVFSKEMVLSERTYEVQSTIKRKNGDVPVNYRLINTNGVWKVYDVVIEGVSLISNYRTQFREILANQSVEALFQTMREKTGKK